MLWAFELGAEKHMERNVRRVLAVAALSVGLSFAGAAVAAAEPDSRPSTVSGNPASCRSAGLPGEILDVTATVRDNTFVDITAVPSGFQLTGVAVKGPRTFSKYPYLGELPWNGLQAPGGTPFTGWFACGRPRPAATTTTTAPTTTVTTTTATTTEPPASSTTSSEQAVTTTTTSTTAAAPQDDELAETGFSGENLVLFGGGLLIAGTAVLVLSARRRRSRT